MANDLSININAKNNTGSAFSGVTSGLKGIESAAGNTSKALNSTGSAFGSFGEKAQSSFSRVADIVGGNLIAGGIEKIGSGIVSITEKLIDFGASAVEASSKFNAGLANIASLGVPMEHIEQYKKEIQSLAVTMGKGTDDLTGGLYQVESAFGDTSDSIKILEINAKAATAGVASTTDSINLTSAATKGYGDTSAQAVQHVADLALKAVELGQTTFPELASSVGKVVPLSKQLGVSQEELFAVMATGSGVTGTTGEVATQYRGILQSLMAPTDTTTKLIKAMGYNSGEAMLKQLGLSKTIQVMVAASQRSGLPLQQFIGSIEGQTLALALAGPQAKKYQENLKGMEAAAGKTDEAFNAQTNGINKVGFKLQQAGIWWETFKQKAGDSIGNIATAVLPALEPLITGMAAKLESFIPIVDAWASDVEKKVSAAYSAAGGGVSGAIAGLGAATGGTLSVTANVTKVDWGTFSYVYNATSGIYSVDWIGKLGDKTTYSYNASAAIFSIDWVSSLDKESTFTYDAKAGIASIDWKYGGDTGMGFTYDAKAGITSVDYRAKSFTYTYDAKAGITEVYFFKGLFTGNYTATASVTSVLWGAWSHSYSVTGTATSVLWGVWTHSYNITATTTSVLWGVWTHSYGVSGNVTSVLWGLYSHAYDSTAAVTSVAWGLWKGSYDASAKVAQSSVLWGAWTTTYNANSSVTKVLWGLFTYKYDATTGISSVDWGVFSHTYAAVANIGEVVWGIWTHTYDVTANITNWIWDHLPNLPFGLGGGGQPAQKATGDSYFMGGWTWVGEQGPELLKLPKGSQILSNGESNRYVKSIANNAAGTTTAPAGGGFTAQENAALNKFAAATNENTKALSKHAKDIQKSFDQQTRTLESALQKVPGLFAPSQVTAEDMAMRDKYKPKVDEILRRVESAANNDKDKGRFAAEIAQAKEALNSVGIQASDDIKTMAAQFKQAWSDQSLFANKANLKLLNTDAIKASLAQQQQQAAGKANLMQFLGIKPDDATAAGAQVLDLFNQGVTKALSGAGSDKTGKGGKGGGGIGTAIVTNAVNSIKDSNVDVGGQLASALDAQLTNSDAFKATGTTVLQKIVASWGDATKSVDLVGGIAAAFKVQIDDKNTVEQFKNLGGKIAQILKAGIDDYFSGQNVADSVSNGVKKNDTTTTTTTPPPAHKAIGTNSFAGGWSWVGESGPELLYIPSRSSITPRSQLAAGGGNVYVTISATVADDLDIDRLAYRVANVIQRKKR